jgi:hypothetical protein
VLTADDILEIHALLARYGHRLDGRDWEGLAALWTEDGTLDFTPIGLDRLHTGRAAIAAFYGSAHHPLAHHCTNIDIHEKDGEVRVHSKWLVPRADGTVGGGDYHDVVARTPEGWRFKLRVGTPRPGEG